MQLRRRHEVAWSPRHTLLTPSWLHRVGSCDPPAQEDLLVLNRNEHESLAGSFVEQAQEVMRVTGRGLDVDVWRQIVAASSGIRLRIDVILQSQIGSDSHLAARPEQVDLPRMCPDRWSSVAASKALRLIDGLSSLTFCDSCTAFVGCENPWDRRWHSLCDGIYLVKSQAVRTAPNDVEPQSLVNIHTAVSVLGPEAKENNDDRPRSSQYSRLPQRH